MKTPILETERLILRPISLGDVPAVQKYFNNWNVLKYTHAPWPYNPDGAIENIKQTIARNELGEQCSWAITLKEHSDELIGRIDYRFFNTPPDRGFWLAEPFHRQGLMSEAVTATQDYVLLDLGVPRIIIENVEENIGSRRVKEKTGAIFLHEKPKSCSPHITGKTQVWEITQKNWDKVRKKSAD